MDSKEIARLAVSRRKMQQSNASVVPSKKESSEGLLPVDSIIGQKGSSSAPQEATGDSIFGPLVIENIFQTTSILNGDVQTCCTFSKGCITNTDHHFLQQMQPSKVEKLLVQYLSKAMIVGTHIMRRNEEEYMSKLRRLEDVEKRNNDLTKKISELETKLSNVTLKAEKDCKVLRDQMKYMEESLITKWKSSPALVNVIEEQASIYYDKGFYMARSLAHHLFPDKDFSNFTLYKALETPEVWDEPPLEGKDADFPTEHQSDDESQNGDCEE